MTARVERLTTEGIFSLDGQDFEVENNVWIVGNDDEVVIVDAPHDADTILSAVSGRRVVAIACTHAHNDHVNAVADVVAVTGAPAYLCPEDTMLWEAVNGGLPFVPLNDADRLEVAGTVLEALHTPGHSPGGMCFHARELGIVFTGDTLFCGGPGATGRSYSDFPTILDSIRERLLTLPPDTRVLTGHGDETTIGSEAESYDDWVARGH